MDQEKPQAQDPLVNESIQETANDLLRKISEQLGVRATQMACVITVVGSDGLWKNITLTTFPKVSETRSALIEIDMARKLLEVVGLREIERLGSRR